MRQAAKPFTFSGCVELRQTLDVHALDERELLHRLGEAPAESIFFHTFGYFLRHRAFTTAYGNDFARWAALEIGDRALAERLAVVDPFAFPALDALREHLVTILQDHLRGRENVDESAIYLHTIETRARERRAEGFAEWLRDALDLPALAERFERVDPYLTTLERVRARLLGFIDETLEEGRG